MAKQQKTYTKEFKLEAVRLVKSSGKPMRLSRNMLYVDGESKLAHLEEPNGLPTP